MPRSEDGPTTVPATAADPLVYGSVQGKWVLLATVLGSGLAQLDGSVVNVALPRIGAALGAGLTSLQWTLNAYTLTLSGLLLLGGSLGDRLGRRRIFVVGVHLVHRRLGAAAVPRRRPPCWSRCGPCRALAPHCSLPARSPSCRRSSAAGPGHRRRRLVRAGRRGQRHRAGGRRRAGRIGAVGLAAGLPDQRADGRRGGADRPPAHPRDQGYRGHRPAGCGRAPRLACLGLAALVFGLTEGPAQRLAAFTVAATAGRVLLLGAFIVFEGRHPDPLLPLSLFRVRQFTAANLVTFAVYAALVGGLFLLPVQLQLVCGFTPVQAGSALLPLTW